MKKLPTCLILLCGFVINTLSSQVALKGKIVEFETGKPVEFANIGVTKIAKGTVSDFDGTFSFVLEETEINQKDTLQISRIGYKTIRFSTQDFREIIKTKGIVQIEAVPYELKGITVRSSDADKRKIGYQSSSKRLFGFWNDSLALGGEHASKILVRKGPVKLEDISFNVIANISDSLLVRVNAYQLEKGLPGENISNGNILHTIKQRQGTITIDLSPYNIVVEDHFVISLELLKIYGGRVGIGISAFDDGSRSFTRLVSQGRWKRMRKGFTIAFGLNTSAVDKMEITQEKNWTRQKPDMITLLWDTSESMKDRDLANELRFLDAYFKNLNNVSVSLQKFCNAIFDRKTFKITNGNWDSLKQELQSTIYDGGSSNRLWEELEISEHTLLFTDGKNFPADVGKDWYGTLFTVNGNINANHKLLKELAEDHGGNYLNLEKLEGMEAAVGFTKYHQADNLEYITRESRQKLSEVTGSVGDLDDPLPNVVVKVRGTDRETKTDSKGNFTLQAHDGEILDFSYQGREKASLVVSTSSQMLKIIMPIGVTALEEVVLEENLKLKELHKPLNKNIATRFGTLDMEKVGFSVKQIDGEKLSKSAQTIMEALQGKFPGVKIIRDYNKNIDLVFIRPDPLLGFPASWDVDGHIYAPDRPPFHINLHNIKDITIMPAAWATARYGRLAPGGIIIIRTISATFDDLETTKNGVTNGQNVQNRYNNDAIELANGISSKPRYAQRIAGNETATQCYMQYLEEKENYGNLPSFYVEAAKLFLDKWKDVERANRIQSNILEQFPDHVDALKILAYAYEEEGHFEEACYVYKQILKANNSPQSKRDLANVLYKLKKYKEAWSMYKNYIGSKNILEAEGLDQLVKNEMLRLVETHGEEIGMDKSKFTFDEQSNYSLIVEWNDPNTQFELQFVNPQGRYYNWNNTVEISNEETTKGNLSASFDLDDMRQGQWLVNMTYVGNQINLPTYLKFTLKNNQTGEDEVKMITLRQRDVKYKVMDLSNQGMQFYESM